MATANNPISHHTSHTIGNGASSSNNGSHGDSQNSNVNGHNQSHVLEAPRTSSAVDDLDLIIKGAYYVPSLCSSGESVLCDTSNSYTGTIASDTTPMCSSINLSTFNIIDSTLREGEQFATAYFNTAQKLEIAKALNDFGVDYIELTLPAASEQSRAACEAICKLGLKAKILCHIRCNMDDAKIAVQTGVDRINMRIGTSSRLMAHSHGKDMAFMAAKADEVIKYVKSHNVEIRFSGEDSFHSDFGEILKLYSLVDRLGADRVGIADTGGGATPMEVSEKVETLRRTVSCDIETHFHDDTGCAVANAFLALEAGATHIDTTVLGIGERNGITSLGGLMACLIPTDRTLILNKYKLEKLRFLEHLNAGIVGVEVPFNNSVMPLQQFD
ncbi:homocitrate synthase [Podospora didyma]|uniref:Homocitrate synthase n=1 Tax=Podospora didyma TaxID=330526 RepID=A0AAE0U370_9PEZI|nr:homocitrate synthase [Podospora didyma]